MARKSAGIASWAETDLPPVVTTKHGVAFDPRKRLWDYRDGLD